MVINNDEAQHVEKFLKGVVQGLGIRTISLMYTEAHGNKWFTLYLHGHDNSCHTASRETLTEALAASIEEMNREREAKNAGGVPSE